MGESPEQNGELHGVADGTAHNIVSSRTVRASSEGHCSDVNGASGPSQGDLHKNQLPKRRHSMSDAIDGNSGLFRRVLKPLDNEVSRHTSHGQVATLGSETDKNAAGEAAAAPYAGKKPGIVNSNDTDENAAGGKSVLPAEPPSSVIMSGKPPRSDASKTLTVSITLNHSTSQCRLTLLKFVKRHL